MVYEDSLSFITFECALFNHSFLGPLVYKMRGEIIDILEETVHTLECTYYICLPFIKHRFPKRVATIQKKTDRHLSLSNNFAIQKFPHMDVVKCHLVCWVLYQLLSFLQCVSILVTYCVFSVVSFVALKVSYLQTI